MGENNVMTTTEAAHKLGVSIGRIHQLIAEKRIEGAYKIGRGRGTWVMPSGDDGNPVIEKSKRKFDKIK